MRELKMKMEPMHHGMVGKVMKNGYRVKKLFGKTSMELKRKFRNYKYNLEANQYQK